MASTCEKNKQAIFVLKQILCLSSSMKLAPELKPSGHSGWALGITWDWKPPRTVLAKRMKFVILKLGSGLVLGMR